jgi:uncharacterized protein YuzE
MAFITYDPEAKALYIELQSDKRIAKTIPIMNGNYMDISDTGEAVGLEILFPASTPQEIIDAIIRLKEKEKEITSIITQNNKIINILQ